MNLVEAHKEESYLFVDSSGTVMAFYDPEFVDTANDTKGRWRFQLSLKEAPRDSLL